MDAEAWRFLERSCVPILVRYLWRQADRAWSGNGQNTCIAASGEEQMSSQESGAYGSDGYDRVITVQVHSNGHVRGSGRWGAHSNEADRR
jgi:hypothetical protein